MKEKKQYDLALKSRAYSGLALRVIVAAYIVYLGWKVLSGTLSTGGPIPVWGAWLIFAGFGAAGVGFCVFAFLQFKKLLKAAQLPPNRHTDDETEGDAEN